MDNITTELVFLEILKKDFERRRKECGKSGDIVYSNFFAIASIVAEYEPEGVDAIAGDLINISTNFYGRSKDELRLNACKSAKFQAAACSVAGFGIFWRTYMEAPDCEGFQPSGIIEICHRIYVYKSWQNADLKLVWENEGLPLKYWKKALFKDEFVNKLDKKLSKKSLRVH